jgi:hypothetical protein
MESAVFRYLCANFCCRRFTKSGATKYAATNNKRSKYRQRLQPVTLDDVAGGCYIDIRHALSAALGSGWLQSVWTISLLAEFDRIWTNGELLIFRFVDFLSF